MILPVKKGFIMKKILSYLVLLLFSCNLLADNTNTRTFTNVQLLGKDSITINGAIVQIGNQILCKNDHDFNTCEAPDLGSPNNNNKQHFARIDTSVNHSNTMAKLVLQSDDEVVYAGLYWSARIINAKDTEIANAKKIRMKGPTATSYTQFTSSDAKFNWWNTNTNNNINSGKFDYGASAEVTQYVKDHGAGNYYVGDIVAQSGSTDTYASWQLIVVVKNSSRSLKNIAIYDGFQSIYNSNPYPASVTVDASKFITPTGNDLFNAYLYIYAGETDTSYGDSSEILDGSGTFVHLVDGANTPNDVMNASVYSPDYTGGYRSNDAGMADPNFRNVLGVDIDKLQINDKTDSSKQILGNGQTSTQIKLSSSDDRYSLNMFAFETEVFVPDFCYDYAYQQQGIYFTEPNDGSQSPSLTTTKGPIVPGEPIQMKVYIRSLVDSALQIQNMTIDVLDINRSQVQYITNTTKLAKVGNLTPQPATVTESSDSTFDYLKDIQVGTLNQNDYFYIYYDLDPQKTTLDMPIKVEASYDLALDATTVGYTLKLSKEIPLCTDANFNYKPAKGIFNIVHNNYYNYDSGGTNRYYNLPTQVTKRPGNFKVLSMDPDNLDDLKGVSTEVAVEMIDASAFHDTNASCSEMASSISPRVWISFDNNVTSAMFDKNALDTAIANGKTALLNSADFYKQARQNVAFRVGYNVDDNGTQLTTTELPSGRVKLTNFPSYAGDKCNPNFGNGHETVPQNCANNGNGQGNNGMTPAELTTCMECIYGLKTKLVCSRDNFAIRPEALMIKLDDQNQTNPTLQTRIDDTISGVATPVLKVLHLSAGYQYNIEVNATNHLNNEASEGYTKTFNLDNSSLASYIFEPRSITVASANLFCNAPVDINLSHPLNAPDDETIRILNGLIDTNTSIDQVGEYRLSLRDTSWTTVDSDPNFMTHHIAPYFTANTDCYSNSDITQNVNAAMNPNDITTLNGCNISSSHTNNEANLEYNDYNVTFHPYKFDVSGISPSVGLNGDAITATSYIYMADINNTQDENMSYHLKGSIVALGEDNSTLSNFVDKCYAVPLDINITTSNRDLKDTDGNHVDYKVRFHDINSSNKVLTALDINVTETNTTIQTNDISIQTVQTPTKGYFQKNQNGKMETRLNLNYDRKKDTTVNPASIKFIKYKVNCTNATNDCTFNADLVNNKTTKGVKDLNSTIPIRHYYGRSHAPRTTIQGSDGNVSMYYEVFCNGTTCNKALLQDGNNSTSTDDPRWFVNTKHTNNLGTAAQSATVQKNITVPKVTVTREANGNHPDYIGLHYDGSRGYPYKTTMKNNASDWLIYNKYDANAATNEFEVEFIKPASNWAGVHETNSTTNRNASDKTNRRLMW